jgi:chaperonin GroES
MARTRPIEDRLIVKYEPYKTVSDGGIIIGDPKKWEHPERIGVVLAVGPGLKNSKGGRNPMTVKTGDKIMFTGTSGIHVDWDDEENVLVITEPDVICILE